MGGKLDLFYLSNLYGWESKTVVLTCNAITDTGFCYIFFFVKLFH